MLRRLIGSVLLNEQPEGLCCVGDMLLYLCRELEQWKICLSAGYIFFFVTSACLEENTALQESLHVTQES